MSTVNLVYFSWVRERIGRPEETLDLPEDVVTIADLLGHLKTRARSMPRCSSTRASSARRSTEHVEHGEADRRGPRDRPSSTDDGSAEIMAAPVTVRVQRDDFDTPPKSAGLCRGD